MSPARAQPEPGEPLDALVARARDAFARSFGREATCGAAAPGRINLIGEHTDYNLGFVLPMAIDRWCAGVAAPTRGPRSRLVAHDLDESCTVSLREALRDGPRAGVSAPAWGRYIVGSIVEHARTLGPGDTPELDVLVASSVPVGGGLSSSAALETASAVLAECIHGRSCDPVARARACQRAEREWAGVPCGLMDQLASGLGVRGHALLIDCRDTAVTPVPVPDECAVLVVDSGMRHELGAGEYAKRRAACESAASRIGVASLRELSGPESALRPGLDDEQARCVRHVTSENSRVLDAAAALRERRLADLGRLMLASHASLRDDYRVSCPELDAIVECVRRVPGAYGARMTGGGFGGNAVVLAAPGSVGAIADALSAARAGARPTGRTRGHGSLPDSWGRVCRVSASDGAHAIRDRSRDA